MNRENKIKLAQAIYTKKIRREAYPLKYFIPIDHPELAQKEVLQAKNKNINVFGGNRSSKSVTGTVFVIQHCLNNPQSDWWAVTWADMMVPVLMAEYNKWLPKHEVRFAQFSDQRGFLHKIIIFRNGSRIRFKTYEQGWKSFQGASKDGIHCDEEGPEDVLKECKARLIDRNGILLRTMTPLNGLTYTYDEVIINQVKDKEVRYWYFDHNFNPHVNKEARERIIGGYADKEREVRSKGHFLNLTSGQAYYAFDNVLNIANWIYNPKLPLEISCDFNVDLMSWNIGQSFNGKDFDFDYVELEGYASTDLMCKKLRAKYPEHKAGWIFYGDISGSKRSPESSLSSWGIIQQNFPDAEIIYQNIKNIKDRVDAVNGRLKNDRGRFAFISENMARLKLDLMRVTWEMLLLKNKAGKLTHSSDGYSYKLFAKYPLYGTSKNKGDIIL